MEILDALKWRYAVKKFDSSKKIPESELEKLLECLRLSPSSYGLQPWKFLVIANPELKEKLRPHSYNQPQITDCSHLIVLCRINEVDTAAVNRLIDATAKTRGQETAELDGYKKMMIDDLVEGPRAKIADHWSAHQVHIALGVLLASAASMQIDACPMEGFSPVKYDEVLGLKEKGLSSVVLCALGYRSSDDKYAEAKKVRFPMSDVIERI